MGMFNIVSDSFKGEIFDFKVKRRVFVASTVISSTFFITSIRKKTFFSQWAFTKTTVEHIMPWHMTQWHSTTLKRTQNTTWVWIEKFWKREVDWEFFKFYGLIRNLDMTLTRRITDAELKISKIHPAEVDNLRLCFG